MYYARVNGVVKVYVARDISVHRYFQLVWAMMEITPTIHKLVVHEVRRRHIGGMRKVNAFTKIHDEVALGGRRNVRSCIVGKYKEHVDSMPY